MSVITGLLWDLLGIVIALLVTGYAYFKWSYLYWKRRNIPYLEPSLPFGNYRNVIKRTVAFGDWVRGIYTEGKSKGYGYFGIYLLSSPMLIVMDLELAKHVMAKDFNNFVNRGVYTNVKDDPLSDHLFATTGKKWRHLRTKLSPTFTSGKLKTMFQTLVDCGLILEKYIENNSERPFNIKDIIGCYSTDIIGSCAFGLDCNSFNEPNSPFRIYSRKAFSRTTFQAVQSIINTSLPSVGRALHFPAFPKDVTDFFKNTVEDAVAYREKNNYTRKDILQLLIELKNNNAEPNEDKGYTLTMDDISATSFGFFLGGSDTSSITVTFTFYLLSIHPEIQDKLREDINTILARYNGQITYDSLNEMKYMKQVIDETMRIFPPVPILQRVCQEDYKIPGEDVIIEKGTTIFMPIIGYQHDEEYFSNPEIFDPDRFSEENKKKIHQYSFMPFGEGPRICLGERFGIMQTKIALTSILRKFKVTLNEKTKVPLKLDPKFALISAEGGLWLNFEKLPEIVDF